LFKKFNFNEVKIEFNKATENKFIHLELENDFIKNCFRTEFDKAKTQPKSQPKPLIETLEEKVTFEDYSDTTSQIINEVRTNPDDITNTEERTDTDDGTNEEVATITDDDT